MESKSPDRIAIAAIFSIASVWAPALNFLAGYAWVIGAILGGLFYYFLMGKSATAIVRAGATR